MRYLYTVLVFLSIFLVFTTCKGPSNSVYDEVGDPKTQFGFTELRTVLQDLGLKATDGIFITIRLQDDAGNLPEEGFQLEVSGREFEVVGGGAAGAMYGALELAEQLRLFGPDGVKPTERNPYLNRRGVKFNIPLDARTPSYTDASDASQKNIPNMWDMNFWTEYLDHLARHRYNYVSLWSLHPFPSLVKVPGYEDVALADVHRSTANWEEYYHLHATGLDAPELLTNPEIVKQISIEEKIEFWRKVMAYGKSRNIDFHLITWNIFTNGTEGKYGITDAIDNEVTKDYFRKSVTQCFLTYPDLAGIGLTTGENMHRQSFEAKENWAYETYAQGILDAAKLMPERKFTFIHRQHQTGAKDIAEKFKTIIDHPNINFIFSFKYAKAHAMSATTQPYHQGFVKDIAGMKTIWGLRNDSNYHFRWGAPGFVREFITNLPLEVAEGIYYGSDQWVQGRDFLTKDPALANRLEIDKHWYHWLLWGRMSYDPSLTDARLTDLLADRFPDAKTKAATLFYDWQDASMVLPTITGFHWGDVDFKWYPEACKSRPGPARNETGFHDVNRFISLPPHPCSGYQSIPDFIAAGPSDTLLPPFEVAQVLRDFSASALGNAEKMGTTNDVGLTATLADIAALGHLGNYYASKIEGATHLAAYRQSGRESERQLAIKALEDAKEIWADYVQIAAEQYHNPLWTNRVGYVDWNQLSEWVEQDVAIAQKAVKGESVTAEQD